MPSMIPLAGRPGVLFLAPHSPAPFEAAAPFVRQEPELLREFAARVADWHDEGTDVALEAATRRSGHHGLRQGLPRGLLDLNRGWKGRVEEKETLFGKGAVDAWTRANLRDGAEAELERWHRDAMTEIRDASRACRALVELHSYGDLGSTYDRQAGGRPHRRAESAIVHGAPWASAFPVGLSRLIPANFRGTPWPVEDRIGRSLAEARFKIGPSPYPAMLPWTVSARFLADRWFRWLGRSGRLDAGVADRLADLAWTDEQSAAVDAAAQGHGDHARDWPGVAPLAAALTAWSHTGADLADRFEEEDGSFTVGLELRIDQVGRAASWGAAVADAVVS